MDRRVGVVVVFVVDDMGPCCREEWGGDKLFNVPMDPYEPMDFMELPVELTFRRISGAGSWGRTSTLLLLLRKK